MSTGLVALVGGRTSSSSPVVGVGALGAEVAVAVVENGVTAGVAEVRDEQGGGN